MTEYHRHTHIHTQTRTRAISFSPPPSSMSTCYPIYPPSDVILSYFDLHSPSPFHFPLPQSLPLPASARPPSLRAEPHTQKPGQQLDNVIVVIFVRWRRAQWSRRAARVKEWKSETNVSNFSMIISGCWTVWRGWAGGGIKLNFKRCLYRVFMVFVVCACLCGFHVGLFLDSLRKWVNLLKVDAGLSCSCFIAAFPACYIGCLIRWDLIGFDE